MEHRWGDRQVTALRIRLHGPGRSLARGWITDISISGAFIRTRSNLPVMSPVQVELTHGSAEPGCPTRLAARVVRRARDGVGIEWEDLAPGLISPDIVAGHNAAAHVPPSWYAAATPRASP